MEEEKRMTLRLPLEAYIHLDKAKDETGKSINQLIVDAVVAQYCPSSDTTGVMVSGKEREYTATNSRLDQILALLRQHGERLDSLEQASVVSSGVIVSEEEGNTTSEVAGLALLTKRLGLSKDTLRRWGGKAFEAGTWEAMDRLGANIAAHDKQGLGWFPLDKGLTYWSRTNPMTPPSDTIDDTTVADDETIVVPDDTKDDTISASTDTINETVTPQNDTMSDTTVSSDETIVVAPNDTTNDDLVPPVNTTDGNIADPALEVSFTESDAVVLSADEASADDIISNDTTQESYTTKELSKLTGKSRNTLTKLMELSCEQGTFKRSKIAENMYTDWVKLQ